MTTAERSKEEGFAARSVQLGSLGASKNPETVALVDEIHLTDAEQGHKLPRAITAHVIPEATDLFITRLRKAFQAALPNCEHSYDPQQRAIGISPRAGAVTGAMIMRLLGTLYRQHAVAFKDIVTASNLFGVTPPPATLDTLKRDLTELWTQPAAQPAENFIFAAPYFRFSPSLRIARGPALVDRIELNLERGTRHSPYVTLHVSHRATALLIANLQASLEQTVGGRLHYDGSTRNLSVVPPQGTVSKEQLSAILAALYATKCIAYNDQADACDAFKLTPLNDDPVRSKERRDLSGLYE